MRLFCRNLSLTPYIDGTNRNHGMPDTEPNVNEGGTNQNDDIPFAMYHTIEDGRDENGAHVSVGLPVQRIVRHVRTARRTKYVVRWYG